MKKKFLSFVIAFMLIIPCVLGLTACGHTHTYNNYGLCTTDGDYVGTTLTVDEQQTGIAANEGEVKYFRFAVQKDHAYYINKSLIQATELTYYDNAGTEIETMGYNEGTAYVAEEAGYIYIVLSASAQISNATLIAHHYVDVLGRSGNAYIGTTITPGTQITLSLEAGKKAYYRFADPGDHQISRTYDNTKLASDDFKFYTTTNTSPYYEQITVDGTPRDFQGPFDEYLYIVITAGATFTNGSFTVVVAD